MADRTLRVAPRPEVHHARSFTFMGRFLHVETFSNLRAPHMLSRIWLFATLGSATVSGMDWQIQLSNDTAKRSLECRRRNAALLTKSNRVIFSRFGRSDSSAPVEHPERPLPERATVSKRID